MGVEHGEAVVVDAAGMGSEEAHVGRGNGEKDGVALYVDGLIEGLAHKGEIDAEAAGEVEEGGLFRRGNRRTHCLLRRENRWTQWAVLLMRTAFQKGHKGQQAAADGGLVAGGLLAGALFHVEMGRIDDGIEGGP